MSFPHRCFQREDVISPGTSSWSSRWSFIVLVGRMAYLALFMATTDGLVPTASAVEADPVAVRFEQTSYQVVPNQAFTVNVFISPPVNGLFSYGLRLAFPSSAFSVASDAIVVPAPLDFNGVLGPGALKQVDLGGLGVKGTIRLDPLARAYREALLATFNLDTKAVNPGQNFALGLEIFRTIGSTETVFVDGEGMPLDDRIAFGSAVVTIVPEPSCLRLLAWPMALTFASRCWRRGSLTS
jgi:hypothetical protein